MRKISEFSAPDMAYVHALCGHVSHVIGVNEEQFEADLFHENPDRFVQALRLIGAAHERELIDTRQALAELLEYKAAKERQNPLRRLFVAVCGTIGFYIGCLIAIPTVIVMTIKRRVCR
jgi:hypothetical protein